jgi:anti-sigma B factor antagonist
MTFTRTDKGDTTLIRIEGALDALSTPEIRPTIEALIEEKRPRVEVDLNALRLIDSSGVGALISLYKRLRASGGELRITGLKDQPLAIFKLLRLERILAPGR